MKEEVPGFLSLSVSPRGFITAIAVVVFGIGVISCFATVFGFLGKYSWFLDLFSHFRVQYMLGLSVVGAVLFLKGYKRAAIVFISFAMINAGQILPMYFGGREVPDDAGAPVRIMLLNVSTEKGDPERVSKLIKEIDPGILVLEEISSKWVRDLTELDRSHPYSRVQTREDNFGIGLFSKFPLTDDEIVNIGRGIPSIVASVTTDQGAVRIIASHPLPPANAEYSKRRNEQLEGFSDYTESPLPLILIGDLNTTPWSYHFKRLLKETSLIDSSQGNGVQATWPSILPVMLIPLDHFLHSSEVFVLKKNVGPNVGSDHYPVIVEFVIDVRKSKQGK